MKKIFLKGHEIELSIVGPEGVACNFCGEDKKEVVVGSVQQTVKIPKTEIRFVLTTHIPVQIFGYERVRTKWFENDKDVWCLREGISPNDIGSFKEVGTGEFTTTNFISHICKDCVKQLASLWK